MNITTNDLNIGVGSDDACIGFFQFQATTNENIELLELTWFSLA